MLQCDRNAIHSLFKRYMQVSVDHARKYGGTGLGLAICKQLVNFLCRVFGYMVMNTELIDFIL
jgi:signal transduction histidine kinase